MVVTWSNASLHGDDMDERQEAQRRRPPQFTLLRMFIAVSGVGAVIAALQQIGCRNEIEATFHTIIGVCFAGAFVIATLKGAWAELVGVCTTLL